MVDLLNEKYDFAVGVDENAVWMKLIFKDQKTAKEFGDMIAAKMADAEPFAVQIGPFLTEVREEEFVLPTSTGH